MHLGLDALIPAEPRTSAELVDLLPVPSAVVRRTGVTLDDLAGFFDQGYGALARTVQPAGPAFAIYRGDPSTTFDLEIGFPVAEPLAQPAGEDVRVEPATWPTGQAMTLTYLGNYAGLGEAWRRLMQAVVAAGRTSTAVSIEVYVTEPSSTADPATLRTDLFALLAP